MTLDSGADITITAAIIMLLKVYQLVLPPSPPPRLSTKYQIEMSMQNGVVKTLLAAASQLERAVDVSVRLIWVSRLNDTHQRTQGYQICFEHPKCNKWDRNRRYCVVTLLCRDVLNLSSPKVLSFGPPVPFQTY